MAFDLLPHSFFTLNDKSDRLRYARFEPQGKARGTVLAVPGRREFIEKKYTELSPLLDRGFRLVVVELRNQGLSSRILSGDKRQRDHIDNFDTHLNDLRTFFAQNVQPDLTPSEPLIAHGHSMGGHLILRWLAEDRPAASAAFVTAPMLAIGNIPTHLFSQIGHSIAHAISWMRAFHYGTEYAFPSEQDFGSGKHDLVFANNPLTQDPKRFPIIKDYFEAHPEMAVGGVTSGWLLAALRSMEKTHSREYMSRIDVPVLALSGKDDRVTPAAEINRYMNSISRARTHTIAQARHDLLNEIDPVRNEAWQRIDGFLKTVTLA